MHCVFIKVKLIINDCLTIVMLLYVMLYIVLAYLMLFAAITNAVCLNNVFFFFSLICANAFFSMLYLCLFHVFFFLIFFYERAMSSPEK